MDYRNAEGSTGYLKGQEFVPFASQEEADASLQPAQPAEDAPEADAPPPRKRPAKE